MPLITVPLPIPGPLPMPAPKPVPKPAPTPTPSPGSVTQGPTLSTAGTIGGAFKQLFSFPISWPYMLALLVMLLTVSLVESWNVEYAWVYVGILLLGITLTKFRYNVPSGTTQNH